MMNILCFFGIHRWAPWGERFNAGDITPWRQIRYCQRCHTGRVRYLIKQNAQEEIWTKPEVTS